MVADKLPRLGQTIQTKWSLLLPEVFQSICSRCHRPQVDLFATRFNNKLPLFVSPVPDPLASACGHTHSAMGGSGCICLPTSRHLGQSSGEVADYPCQRIILIAPGWPNMLWFWDLVAMSSQIPLSLPNLPNLLTQPVTQIPHGSLTNLNLHAGPL